jgi:hypothetical protein
MTNSERDLRTFMKVMQDVAIAKAKLMPTTPDIQHRAARLVAFGHEKIAEMRRETLAQRRTNVVSGAIRDAFEALPRNEVIAKLTALWSTHPDLQFAFRECDDMPDDDLRSMLEDATSLIERRS